VRSWRLGLCDVSNRGRDDILPHAARLGGRKRAAGSRRSMATHGNQASGVSWRCIWVNPRVSNPRVSNAERDALRKTYHALPPWRTAVAVQATGHFSECWSVWGTRIRERHTSPYATVSIPRHVSRFRTLAKCYAKPDRTGHEVARPIPIRWFESCRVAFWPGGCDRGRMSDDQSGD
jgi:hypothetical protein